MSIDSVSGSVFTVREDLRILSVKDLITKLEEMREYTYTSIRAEYLDINRELTRRTSVPPSLRPLRARAWRRDKKYTQNDALILQDLIVIDMHWLFQTDRERMLKNSRVGEVFAKREFSEDIARKWAEKDFSIVQKINEWRIPERDQYFLSTLRSVDVSKNLKGIIQKSERVEDDLVEISLNDKRVKPLESDWKELWLARELCRKLLLSGEPSAERVSEMYRMISGKDRARPTVAAKLKRIDDRLARTSGRRKEAA